MTGRDRGFLQIQTATYMTQRDGYGCVSLYIVCLLQILHSAPLNFDDTRCDASSNFVCLVLGDDEVVHARLLRLDKKSQKDKKWS